MRVADYDSIASGGYEARYRLFEHRGIEDALAAFVAGTDVGTCLEVGTGTGHWLSFLSRRRVVGLDLSAAMLAGARARAAGALLVRGDAGQLPLAAASFGRVFCVNALHHFRDKRQFLLEARRVLRDGGAFMNVGLDPHTGSDRWWMYEYFPEAIALDRERYESAAAIRAEMARAGFVRCDTVVAQHVVSAVPAEQARADGQLDRGFTSQLMILDDEEYDRGVRRLRDDIGRASGRGLPLMLRSDLYIWATTGWKPERTGSS